MSEFKLAASLEGHGDDVRSVSYPQPSLVITASRDSTVRTWKKSSGSNLYEGTIASQGSAFVNAVTYLAPSEKFPEGLIVSGGKDTVIEVREPGKAPDVNAERLLLGHAHNICTLDSSPTGDWVVSGSWDASARVWNVDTWECEAILEPHEASVWSVLAYDKDTIITACADKLIRVFSPTGKLLRTVQGNTDVVRALCKVPKGHASRADFASAGNDALIRLWKLDGTQVGVLQGHDNFIYSLACLPTGELVSSGEDRTVKIWKDDQCVQTITHPAISVWTIAVCAESGDFVSGASDSIARVFTRDPERHADAQFTQAFEESVKGSSIPQQQVGEINKEKLPGPEFLTQKSGTKEGQVVMIKESNGSVTAHTWSTAANQWVNVGTVVDAVGSSGKKVDYHGKDYDYVFDVDIEDGKPPLKLPYNLSQNPYEAATKFLEDSELPATYLDQVANFITTNTQGATIGQSSQQPQPSTGADPWGSEARYRPGDQSQATPLPAPTQRSAIPQTQYLSIKSANLKTIQKKLEELNEQLLASGSKGESLNPPQIESLRQLTSKLESDPSKINREDDSETFETLFHVISVWPPASRLPGLDILRLLTASSPAIATPALLGALEDSGVFTDTERPNNQMLALRAIANLFETSNGREVADACFHGIHESIHPFSDGPSNRNLTVALTTLLINYAVLLTSDSHKDLPSSLDRALTLLDDITRVLKREKDSEVVYRALVALGTLLVLGEDVQNAAKEIYEAESIISKAESSLKEPRVKLVVGDIQKMLH